MSSTCIPQFASLLSWRVPGIEEVGLLVLTMQERNCGKELPYSALQNSY